MEVYILNHCEEYEGIIQYSVHKTLEGAKSFAKFHGVPVKFRKVASGYWEDERIDREREYYTIFKTEVHE